MKVRSLFLALPLLLSPALVHASDYVENGSSAIWSLRQLSDLNGDSLPQVLLNVLGQNLIELEGHGAWLPAGTGKRWVPVEKIVSYLTAFRDNESSEDEIAAVLEVKEQIKEGLLEQLSAQWEEGLEDLMKESRQHESQLVPSKAYGAGVIAYYMVEISAARKAAYNAADSVAPNAAYYAAYKAARNAAWLGATTAATTTARNVAMKAATKAAWLASFNSDYNAATNAADNAADNAAYNAATSAAYNVAWLASYDTAYDAVHASIKRKLIVLASKTAGEIGSMSYDLAELFTMLWLTENAHESMKKAFDAAYETFPEMELDEAKAVIEAAINKVELIDNMFIKVLKRNLDALEKFVLAK